MPASVKAYATPRPPESTQNHSYESRLDPDPLEAAPPAIRAAQCTRTRRRIRRDRALHRARAFFTTASSRFTPDRTRARSRTRLQTSRFENGGRDSHDARDDGRLAPRVRVVRVDRARRPRASLAKLFLRLDRRRSRRTRARDDVRAATRLPRAPRRGLDECGAPAARARRGSSRVRLETGFRYVYHAFERPCSITRKRTNSLGTSRVGRSVGRSSRSLAAVARGRSSPSRARASSRATVGGDGASDERADADEHARRARERHHERRTTHRRHAARVRPGDERDLGGLRRARVLERERRRGSAVGSVHDTRR